MSLHKIVAASSSVWLGGLGVIVGLSGCSSSSDPGGGTGAGGAAASLGGFGGDGQGLGSGGVGGPNGAGGGVLGAGGGTFGAGGSGNGGGAFGAGGGINPGAGGGSNPGAGGGSNPGAGGGAGVTLQHCDQASESSAHPVTEPCSDMTTVVGTKIEFGPLGARMDVNVGKGFENPDPADNATCPAFAALFNEPQYTPQLLDVGTQPCTATAPNTGSCLDFKLYSVYYPANWPSGPIPVLVWGNGTCAQPEGYGPLLRYVASYGFFIVAANSREIGDGTAQKKAIDFAAAANQDSSSPYFGHLDLSKVGAMGHSQGGQGTAAASADSRVVSAILFNPLSGTAAKPFMFVSGDMDIINTSPTAMQTAIAAQSKGAYFFYHNPVGASADTLKGHLVLMLSPERVTEQTVAWWQATLLNDPTATAKFVGQNCAFCTHATDYAFGEQGM